MLFKENASKLLSISRMTKDEYVQKEEEPDKILNEEIPKAMQIFTCSLSDGYFCDVGSTPLAFLARQVGDILVVEYQCTDSAAGEAVSSLGITFLHFQWEQPSWLTSVTTKKTSRRSAPSSGSPRSRSGRR